MYEKNRKAWREMRMEDLRMLVRREEHEISKHLLKIKDLEYQLDQLDKYPFVDIQWFIKNGKTAVDVDLRTFGKYADGEYTLAETIKTFMWNHGITEETRTFSDEEFRRWLCSLNYYGIYNQQ